MKKLGSVIVALIVLSGAGYLSYRLLKPGPVKPYHPENGGASSGQVEDKGKLGVKLSQAEGGHYLTDSDGMTLYYFAKDGLGQSNCPPGQCLDLWPSFVGETLSVESPLSAADFSDITGSDGRRQTAFRGMPLYYFANDKKPGDRLGEGSLGVWFTLPVPFYTVLIEDRDAAGGRYLADKEGKTLYVSESDTQGTSTSPTVSVCDEACLSAWPAFFSDRIIAPSGVSAGDFSAVIRTDGVRQLAYKGRPLYYAAQDAGPGDLSGQDAKDGLWTAAKP